MNKEEKIEYLNRIRPYINLKAVCEDYNQKHTPPIDYNNLRAVLNGVSMTRLSEDRLTSFIDYLYTDLYRNIFIVESASFFVQDSKIEEVIDYYSEKMKENLIREYKNGFSD